MSGALPPPASIDNGAVEFKVAKDLLASILPSASAQRFIDSFFSKVPLTIKREAVLAEKLGSIYSYERLRYGIKAGMIDLPSQNSEPYRRVLSRSLST
jgi:hypothetical protein